jgi:DNA-binding transcriptional regulator GbsR (MarR family)
VDYANYLGYCLHVPNSKTENQFHDSNTVPLDIVAEGQERFIALWGDMGARWGVPRSMTELHAMLYIVGESMNTDEIMKKLSISRGNASMTLRTLLDWGIVTRTHKRDDRKDYYTAEQDVWKLFATVARARKRRELEPLASTLQALANPLKGVDTSEVVAQRKRLESMLEFIDQFDGISERFLSMGGSSIEIFAKLLGTGNTTQK